MLTIVMNGHQFESVDGENGVRQIGIGQERSSSARFGTRPSGHDVAAVHRRLLLIAV